MASILAGATIGLLASYAAAEPSKSSAALPGTLAAPDVVAIARKQRKEIVAARERARAAWEGSRAEGKLPDPMLMTNLDHLPIPPMGADFSAMWQQQIPLSGELGARVRRAEALARTRDAEVKTVALDVEVAALEAFFMLAEEQGMRRVVADQLALAQGIEKVVEARLASGSASASDALRAGLERARLETELDTFESRLRAADAMLDAALGRKPDAAIPKTELVVRDVAPAAPNAVARTALAERPEVEVMRRRIGAAEEDVEVMRNMRAPMGIFGLGGAYTMADGPGLMATVGISLPIWVDKYDRRIDEAKAMVSMERSELAAMQVMVEGEAVAAREQVEAARIRERSIRIKLLPQATSTFETVLASYASGQVPVVSVLESAAMLRMLQMEHVRSRTELAVRWAVLGRRLGNVELGFLRAPAVPAAAPAPPPAPAPVHDHHHDQGAQP